MNRLRTFEAENL